MKTFHKNSNTMQWQSDIESNTAQEIQTATQYNEELYLAEQKSLLFQMYELEEEDLFV